MIDEDLAATQLEMMRQYYDPANRGPDAAFDLAADCGDPVTTLGPAHRPVRPQPQELDSGPPAAKLSIRLGTLVRQRAIGRGVPLQSARACARRRLSVPVHRS